MVKNFGMAVIILSFSFWPLSLFLANTWPDFLRYFVPTFLVGLSFILFRASTPFYLVPLLFIPFIEPKLAALPVLATSSTLTWRRKRVDFLLAGFSILVLLFSWKGFWGQTIFVPDYERQQTVVGKTYLYPSVFLARTFQNKIRIYTDKFTNNFFALSDPNNYFFGFHPREIVIDNQNLKKYPFPGIIFMLFGLYYLCKNPHAKFVFILLISSVLSLSILTIFDRNDFILWLPLSLIFIHGVRVFEEKKYKFKTIFYISFLIFTITEAVRILVT